MGVMTAIAIGGLAISAASATKSFIDAGKQRRAQKEAENAANAAMAEARKKLDVNFYDAMAINKEPYELAKEAMLVQGSEAIQAGVESERGAAATAGKVQMAMNEGQAGIRTEMGKEMMDIQNKQLTEDSRLRDVGVQLDTEEAAGAQQAAADAQKAAAAANAQGFASATQAAQQGLSMVNLYQKSGSTNQLGGLEKNYNASVAKGGMKPEFYDAQGKALPFQQAVGKLGSGYGFDVAGVGSMNPMAFNDYMTQQSAKNLKNMRGFDFYAGN